MRLADGVGAFDVIRETLLAGGLGRIARMEVAVLAAQSSF